MTHTLHTKRHKAIFLALFLMTAKLVIGCSRELSTDELPTEHNDMMLSFTTKAGEDVSDSSDNETVVKSLRLMIFNSRGVQIKNAFYEEAALEGLKTDGGTFTVIARLPRDLGQIKVCLIANEPGNWDLGRSDNKVSYTALNNLTIHYSRDFDFIGNNGNSDDLNLYIPPADCFLMVGETTLHFIAGDTKVPGVLPLHRTVAKVTLTLTHDRLQGVDYDNGEDFVLKSASIQNQPIYSHFSARAYDNDEFFPTAGKPLVYVSGTQATHPATFYIPEHYLSAEAFGSGLNTFIELLGEYTTGGLKIPVTYKIPLGEGAQNIVSNSGYTPVIADYSVVRNHHYVVKGTIIKLGEKEGIQAKVSILPWKVGSDIDVETPAPYLNISEIALDRTVPAADAKINDKIFFWSNQSQEQITLGVVSATFYNQDGTETDIFALPAMYHPQIDVEMIKYAASGAENNFYGNNGHIAINVQLPTSIGWSRLIVTFYVKAGNLKRLITITYTT